MIFHRFLYVYQRVHCSSIGSCDSRNPFHQARRRYGQKTVQSISFTNACQAWRISMWISDWNIYPKRWYFFYQTSYIHLDLYKSCNVFINTAPYWYFSLSVAEPWHVSLRASHLFPDSTDPSSHHHPVVFRAACELFNLLIPLLNAQLLVDAENRDLEARKALVHRLKIEDV